MAEALDPNASPPSSFQSFATETLRRLNDGIESLQRGSAETIRSIGDSMEEIPARMEGAWGEALEKFQSLRGHARSTYDALERRTVRSIEQFERWLAGDQTRPSRPRPEPGRMKGSGPPIAV
ncbi:MAG: hypothetical protein ACPW61_02785 [Methyloligella sp. ZOD6]